MKKLLVVVILAVAGLTFSGHASAPETRSECLTRCASEKIARDQNCPVGGQYTDVARQKCLDSSNTTYRSCTNSCPKPPSPRPSDRP